MEKSVVSAVFFGFISSSFGFVTDDKIEGVGIGFLKFVVFLLRQNLKAVVCEVAEVLGLKLDFVKSVAQLPVAGLSLVGLDVNGVGDDVNPLLCAEFP